nr:hypothetical protein [uncultured Desulfobacter sp.]
MFMAGRFLRNILFCFILLFFFANLSLAAVVDNIDSTFTTSDWLYFYGGTYEINADGDTTEVELSSSLIVRDGAVVNIIGNGESGSAKLSTDARYAEFGYGDSGTLNVSNGGSFDTTGSLFIATLSTTGALNIDSGGTVSANKLRLAFNGSGNNGTINVDGAGSSLTIDEGSVLGGSNSTSTVNITNGGLIQGGNIQIGSGTGSTNNVNVSGRSVETWIIWEDLSEEDAISFVDGLNYDDQDLFWFYDSKYQAFVGSLSEEEYETLKSAGQLSSSFFETLSEDEQAVLLGNESFATQTVTKSTLIVNNDINFCSNSLEDTDTSNTMTISDYGLVEADLIWLDGDAGQSSIDISDMGELNANYIIVGSTSSNLYDEETDSATLSVRDTGVVNAGQVTLYASGTLKGDGTINGNVYVRGGVIAPGNSPGTLTINGDLEVIRGSMEIEIASSDSYDFFDVSGDIYIGEEAIIEIILSCLDIESIDITTFFSESLIFEDGFDPLTNIILSILGIDEDDTYSVELAFYDKVYTYTESGVSLTDDGLGGGSSVPIPSTLFLFGAGLLSLAGARRKLRK